MEQRLILINLLIKLGVAAAVASTLVRWNSSLCCSVNSAR